MTWVAYAAGAYGAASLGYAFDLRIFWLGYLWLFLVEVATVLSNEYQDYNTDRQNKYFGPFTGGSRVIVDNQLSFKEVKNGIILSIVLSLLVAVLLLSILSGSILSAGLLMIVLFIMALGYTIPPLRLSYKGLGELDVGITHSFGVILCGFVFQGGSIVDSFPWLLSVPLFLALIPSIILAGIPDYEADKMVLKNSIPIIFGRKGAVKIAMFFVIVSALTAVTWSFLDIASGALGNAVYVILPHAAILVFLLNRYLKDPMPRPHVNMLLFTSLTYIIWFGIIPLITLF